MRAHSFVPLLLNGNSGRIWPRMAICIRGLLLQCGTYSPACHSSVLESVSRQQTHTWACMGEWRKQTSVINPIAYLFWVLFWYSCVKGSLIHMVLLASTTSHLLLPPGVCASGKAWVIMRDGSECHSPYLCSGHALLWMLRLAGLYCWPWFCVMKVKDLGW